MFEIIPQSGFIHAAMTGNVAIVRMLVKLPVVDVNLADNEGNAALHLAAQAGTVFTTNLTSIRFMQPYVLGRSRGCGQFVDTLPNFAD